MMMRILLKGWLPVEGGEDVTCEGYTAGHRPIQRGEIMKKEMLCMMRRLLKNLLPIKGRRKASAMHSDTGRLRRIDYDDA